MSAAAWLTVVVVALAVVAMARQWLPPPTALGGALAVVLVAGVVPVDVALGGFASPALLLVGALFIFAGSMERSSWLGWLAQGMFGDGEQRAKLGRTTTAVAALSAFVSNTAVVAALIPVARHWAKERNRPVSELLMPISFAAILGGTCTLIGTSTNLVVQGLLLEQGDRGMSMFELALVGVPMALLGLCVMVLTARWLLPARSDPLELAGQNPRQYVARLAVAPTSSLVGQRVSDLRSLRRLYLAGIERGERVLTPVAPDQPIRAADVLVFVGLVESIRELAATRGLEPVDAGGPQSMPEWAHLVEAVVSPSSPLVGQNIREAGFRARYGAAVVGVHRHGEQIHAKIGDIVVRPGDTLLLMTGADFAQRWGYASDFLLVTGAGTLPEPPAAADWIEPVLLAVVVLVAAIGWLTLLQAVLAGLALLIAARRLSPRRLWHFVDWQTLVTIGAAIGLASCLSATGAVDRLAALLHAASGSGALASVAAIVVTTALLTEVVTNTAAAALVFPVAMRVGAEAGLAPHAVAIAVALAASCAFLTPVGYHTNTMVTGAGGYTFGDFVRFGLPVKVVSLAVVVVMVGML